MPKALVTICYLINITLSKLEIYSLTNEETNLERVRTWSWAPGPALGLEAPDSCSVAPVSGPGRREAGTEIRAAWGPAGGELKVAHGSWLHAERAGSTVV